MSQVLKEIVQSGVELTVDERNLFSVAYRSVVQPKLMAHRIVCSMEQKYENESQKLEMIKEYNTKIKDDIVNICNEVLQLLDQYLIPSSQSNDFSMVFYLKLKGDFFRYLSYICLNNDNEMDDLGKNNADNALKSYELATNIAENLPVTHPIRLGLALNFSVFYVEILKDYDTGMYIAKNAFSAAVGELETLSEEMYSETTRILQLLR